MDFYLLDTNIFSNLYNLRRDKYSDVCSAIGALDPDAPQYLSVVVLGELLFGLRMVEGAGQDLNHIRTTIKRAEERPLAEIGLHTAEAYGRSDICWRDIGRTRRESFRDGSRIGRTR